MMAYLIALACVFGIAIGQVLFKISAIGLSKHGFFHFDTFVPLVSSMALYGFTSLVWVWALQKISLGQIYPLMALAFVLVPIASYFIFDEKFGLRYFIGILFIIIGIFMIIRK